MAGDKRESRGLSIVLTATVMKADCGMEDLHGAGDTDALGKVEMSWFKTK